MHYYQLKITIYTFLLSFIFIRASNGQVSLINYTDSDENFINPERGFYRYSQTKASNYTFLNEAELVSRRSLHEPHNDGYQIYASLVFRYFELDDFVNDSISAVFLDNLQTDFNTVRNAGVKIIPRFAYIISANMGNCGSFICPPYGDAPKARVLQHIAQFEDVLKANADVIAVVQMGFIGTWGEQYYTDYFGDASQSPFVLTDTNWEDRNEVVEALLNSTPENRMIQVRYPQLKQRYVYGINANTAVAALTEAKAYQNTDKARIAFHNDCILASSTDFGTYNDYGNSSSSSTEDTANLKPYLAANTKFTAMGGETCSAYNPYDNCTGTDPDARADSELKRMHYSYLNADFNYPEVNSDWIGNCMDEIQKELGYRFVLLNAEIESSVETGGSFNFYLSLKNLGFAAPYNERAAQLVMRNASTGKEYFANLDTDPRYWFRELSSIDLNQSFCLPYYMEAGDYQLFLFLGDASSSIYERSEYAIRIASILSNGNDVWESATGYNQLGHTITVTNPANLQTCDGEFAGFKPCKNLNNNHIVLNNSDNGIGSLRNIIENAACGDTIFIPAALDNQHIILSGGEIAITNDVVIIGTNAANSVLTGNASNRIFNIASDVHVYLHNITLTNATSPTGGGAFLNEGYLFLKDVELTSNLENGSPKSFTNNNQLIIQTGNTILKE